MPHIHSALTLRLPQSLQHILSQCLCALLYFFCSQLSTFLTISHQSPAALWPPAAVALAFTFLYGSRFSIAIFAGAFTNSIFLYLNTVSSDLSGTALIGCLATGIGAALQALFGRYLLRHIFPISPLLAHYKDFVFLLVCGGFISCLINALLAPIGLYYAEAIPAENLPNAIFTWWAGDVIGITLFAPVLVLLLNPNILFFRKTLIGLPLLTFSVIFIFAFYTTQQHPAFPNGLGQTSPLLPPPQEGQAPFWIFFLSILGLYCCLTAFLCTSSRKIENFHEEVDDTSTIYLTSASGNIKKFNSLFIVFLMLIIFGSVNFWINLLKTDTLQSISAASHLELQAETLLSQASFVKSTAHALLLAPTPIQEQHYLKAAETLQQQIQTLTHNAALSGVDANRYVQVADRLMEQLSELTQIALLITKGKMAEAQTQFDRLDPTLLPDLRTRITNIQQAEDLFLERQYHRLNQIEILSFLIQLFIILLSIVALLYAEKSRILIQKFKEIQGCLSAILETAPDGILSVDETGIIKSANNSILQIFGYTEKELINHPLDKLIPASKRAQHKPKFEHYAHHGSNKMMAAGREVVGLHKDGSEIPLEIGLSRTKMPNGSTQIIAAIHDITDLRKMEKNLLSIGRILENSFNEIFFFDAETLKFIQVNKGARENLGYTMAELSVMTPLDIKQDLSEAEFNHLIAPLRANETDHVIFDTRHRRKDGSTYDVEIYLQKTEYQLRPVFSAIAIDTTEKNIARQKQERLIDTLSYSNEELERFAFICSHDLQEPLRMIRSFSDLLISRHKDSFSDDETGQRYLNYITENAAHAQNLIADILSYSSIDHDTQALETFEMTPLLETIKQNALGGTHNSQAEITYDPMPVLHGNRTQIFQVFQNLITNGLKYQTVDKPAKVHVSVTETPSHYQFCITDNGIGIEEKHRQKIFEVFQRLHRRDQYSGTGIGLSICKKVVKRHGGTIWVESEPEQGSHFMFTIAKPHLQGAPYE